MKRIWVVALVVATAAGCTDYTDGEPGAPPLPRHELLMARHSDAARKDYDIWRMCGDGSQLASLVAAPGAQLQVTVAPDGNAFIYASRVEGQWDLFRADFGNNEPENITRHPANDSQPEWSPDGGYLVFSSTRESPQAQLYLMELASREARRLTSNEYHDSGAALSPDGRTVAFTRYFGDDGGPRSGTGEIFALDLASGQETRLTDLGGYNGDVSYSPDGRTLAFHRVAEGRAEIWMMGAGGEHPAAITDTVIDEYSPAWSPDGQWLAVTAGTGNDSMGTFDIWLMRPDGSARRRLNDAPNTEAWHVWRPGQHYCR